MNVLESAIDVGWPTITGTNDCRSGVVVGPEGLAGSKAHGHQNNPPQISRLPLMGLIGDKRFPRFPSTVRKTGKGCSEPLRWPDRGRRVGWFWL